MNTCLNITYFGRTDGLPLVMLHGFMGRAASFDNLVSFLPRAIRPVGIDLPGHGESLFSGSSCIDGIASFKDVAETILEDLSRLHIEAFWLYGYSMGGRIAQQVGLSAPGRVKGLILESASFGIADPEARKMRYDRDCRLFEDVCSSADFEAFLGRWHDMDLFCTLTPQLKARLAAAKQKNSILQLEKAMGLMSVGNQPYLVPALSSAQFPMALFCGEKDVKYRSIAEGGAKNLPKACLRIFKGASHNIHVQYPRETAGDVRSLVLNRKT